MSSDLTLIQALTLLLSTVAITLGILNLWTVYRVAARLAALDRDLRGGR